MEMLIADLAVAYSGLDYRPPPPRQQTKGDHMSDVDDLLYGPIETKQKAEPPEPKRSIYDDLEGPPPQRFTVIIDGNPVEIVLSWTEFPVIAF